MPVIEPTEIIPPRGRYVAASPYSGVLGSRLFAFLIDVVAVGVLWGIATMIVLTMGLLTFGLAWLLLPALWPIVALFYNGLTVSGPRRGTWGMRVAGIQLVQTDGGRVPFVTAAAHAVLFYVSVSVLTPLVLLIGMVRNDRRLLHDLLVGTVAVRRDA